MGRLAVHDKSHQIRKRCRHNSYDEIPDRDRFGKRFNLHAKTDAANDEGIKMKASSASLVAAGPSSMDRRLSNRDMLKVKGSEQKYSSPSE